MLVTWFLMITEYIQKVLSASKFASKWKGPYVIGEAYHSGYFLIC